ncbi:tetratricopeptide repeat protein [Nodosilinea sp. LEGE 07298]|nr:tetratricopeptide repeat protein [Nodosilinea sp. LEGE 07298]MBE9107827.1 tetratricopeptide repeat protein [Nodosilinea sp. LEGE 07298]
MSTKRFRIAFSFAGEKREFVEAIATLLTQQFGQDKILYDKYHEAEFGRNDLGIYLPNLYNRDSNLVVVIVCPNYDAKEWTGLEWLAIHNLLQQRRREEVMLCRFARAQVDGLFGGAGFVELDHKSPAQAATLILERLALNEGRPKDYYTKNSGGGGARSSANIPHNLPRLQAFFGREAELQKIATALAPEARGWGALIDGPGGMGKTALAIRAAELVPAGRFQRIIFLSSKERELTADGQRSLGYFVLPSYLEMLNAIARELDQPDLAKAPETERSDAILRALREAEVLLVLDNLETLPETDRDRLFAFLDRLPRGCSAIVTSRRRADAMASILRLDRLDWPAAQALLADLAQTNAQLAPTTEPERRALYEETGGNPLLMRWVVGQLGLGRCQTIAAALAFLRRAPAENNPLEFVFGDLLDTFTANETQVLAALTHFTQLMPAKIIVELACLNEAAAQGALSDLANRALVLPDSEERHFALVPLVADFLRKQKPEVVAETGNRLEQRAYALIVENSYKKYDRFPVLDAAWPTVAAAIPLFLAGPNPRLQKVCAALFQFFNFTGRYDESLSLNQQAETRAIAADDLYNAGWRAHQVGWIHQLRQQADAVLAWADRAATHWQAAGARERAVAIGLRGIGHQLKQDYPTAISAYREALDLYRSLSAESEDVAIALNSLAGVEKLSGDFAAAERDLREALRVARAVDYAEGVASYTGNLAALALDQKDWPGAETLACEALSLSEKVGRQELIAEDCRRIAKALVRQGQAAEALPYARRAVAIYTQLGSPDLANAQAILRECEG